MRPLALLAGAAAIAALVGPALAQTRPDAGRPGAGAPATSGSTNPARRVSTLEFLRMAAIGDRFEIAASRLAEERAQGDQVKQFARNMVQDHTRTTQQLQELTQRLGATRTQTSGREGAAADGSRAGSDPGAASGAAGGGGGVTTAQGGMPPEEGLDARHQQMLAQLQAAQGQEFDRLYARTQVQVHREAVQMFETYAQGGENAELRQWAQQTAPVLQDHLQKAHRMQAALGG
jgi:putative membrane protein